MVLKDSLFKIIEKRVEDNHAEVEIALDIHHPIYTGHFPGDPITPGVCVAQIAVELCESLLEKKMELTGSKAIKFINLIRPNEYPQVTYVLDWSLNEGQYAVKVVVKSADKTFAKCSLRLTEITE